jgi:hypothetical protein
MILVNISGLALTPSPKLGEGVPPQRRGEGCPISSSGFALGKSNADLPALTRRWYNALHVEQKRVPYCAEMHCGIRAMHTLDENYV